LLAVTTFHADPGRLKKFGRTKDKIWTARFLRFALRDDDSPIPKYYDD